MDESGKIEFHSAAQAPAPPPSSNISLFPSVQTGARAGTTAAVTLHEQRFGRPVVFGDPACALAGRLHPARVPARGAVVLCSPWGYEDTCAYATVQALAQQLAGCGFDTLRFDYEGWGNSSGDGLDPQQFIRWIDSIEHAMQFMSAQTAKRVGLVGLRLGAALVTLASSRLPAAATVLWDPVVNGRRYLRALRSINLLGVSAGQDPSEPGGIVALGHRLNAATVSALEQMDLQKIATAQTGNTLIIGRPGASEPGRLAARLVTLGISAEAVELPGTDRMIDATAEDAQTPQSILDRITGFLGEHLPGEDLNEAGSAAGNAAAAQAATRITNQDWTEERISVGSQRLAGTLTLPRNQRHYGGVLMINSGVGRSTGPARVWVEWARAWAAAGIASLRLDLGGLGDSPEHPGQARNQSYPIEAIDDVHAGAAELQRHSPGAVVALGLCSGAFLALDAAASRPGLSGVLGINGQLFYVPDPPKDLQRRRAAPPTNLLIHKLLKHTQDPRSIVHVVHQLPYVAWRALDLLRLHPMPLRGADAAARNARVLLIYGADDFGFNRLRQRAPRDLDRWQREGRLITIEGLDHSMFSAQASTVTEPAVRRFLLEMLPASEEASVHPRYNAPAPGTWAERQPTG